MPRAAGEPRAIGHQARSGSGGCDDVIDGLVGAVLGHRHEELVGEERRDRREVEARIVRQVVERVRMRDHVRHVDLQKVVAVGLGLLQSADGDEAVSAGTVVHHHRLLPFLRQLLGDDAQRDLGARARGERRDDAHRPRGERVGGVCERDCGREQGASKGTQRAATGKRHGRKHAGLGRKDDDSAIVRRMPARRKRTFLAQPSKNLTRPARAATRSRGTRRSAARDALVSREGREGMTGRAAWTGVGTVQVRRRGPGKDLQSDQGSAGQVSLGQTGQFMDGGSERGRPTH